MYNIFYNNIFDYMQTQCETPKPWGWYHLLCLALVGIITFLFIKYFRKFKDKQFRLMVFICWLTIFLLEIYKQITMSYSSDTESFTYQWYIFPFQFCSTPLYVLPFIVFLKDSKSRDAFIGFMAFYSLFAGICVYFVPDSVFCMYLGINIQTMVHHGLQIILGIYMGVYLKNKVCLSTFIRSMLIFLMFLGVAVLLNTIVTPRIGGYTFNMFFVNPKFSVGMPILQTIQDKTPYLIFFICYLFGFTLCAFIMYLITCLINKQKPFNWKSDITTITN